MSRRNVRQISILITAVILALASLLKAPAKDALVAINHGPQVAAVASSSAETLYAVTKVVDGDTIKIQMSGKPVTVRLIGLDTPEIVDPRKPVQCFAKEASDKAKEILTNQSVRIEQDPSQGSYDKYGRLLAYIYEADGTLFNKYMISEGYGHEYTYDLPYKYQKEFKAAEAAARDAQKGLWAPQACGGGAI